MKFKFEKTAEYGKKGPVFYETTPIPITLYGFHPNTKLFCKAYIENRVNGKETCYGQFFLIDKTFTNSDFHKSLSKHFKGEKALFETKHWLNWLLNNCPNYIN
jgi:hypothetical protein